MTVGTGAFTMEYWDILNSITSSPIVLSANLVRFFFRCWL